MLMLNNPNLETTVALCTLRVFSGIQKDRQPASLFLNTCGSPGAFRVEWRLPERKEKTKLEAIQARPIVLVLPKSLSRCKRFLLGIIHENILLLQFKLTRLKLLILGVRKDLWMIPVVLVATDK